MTKTVLVTGASGGIGSAVARLFAEKGYNVAVHYHTAKDAAQMLCEEIGAMAVCADMTKEEEIKAMIEAVEERYGGIDVLVNNAGIAMQKMLCDTDKADWDRVFSVNMTATFLASKYAMEGMVRRKFGKIINISSIWGEVGASCEVAYSASKAAVIGFTKALAKELSLSGVCVNCITPGVIDTKMNSIIEPEILAEIASEIPAGRLGEPREVAEAVLFLASEKSNYITGQIIGVNGGENM